MANENEEIIKLFKQKYNLTEEQSEEIISIVKASVNECFDDNCVEMINIADKLNTKYAGKMVYYNQYEAGGWICNCQRVVYDVNMDCIRFEGDRYVLQLEYGNKRCGYTFVYADNSVEYDFDEDELEVLESMDDVNKIIDDMNEKLR